MQNYSASIIYLNGKEILKSISHFKFNYIAITIIFSFDLSVMLPLNKSSVNNVSEVFFLLILTKFKLIFFFFCKSNFNLFSCMFLFLLFFILSPANFIPRPMRSMQSNFFFLFFFVEIFQSNETFDFMLLLM